MLTTLFIHKPIETGAVKRENREVLNKKFV
jgi:hypothetical protein